MYVTAEKECTELKNLKDELSAYMGMQQYQTQEVDINKKDLPFKKNLLFNLLLVILWSKLRSKLRGELRSK